MKLKCVFKAARQQYNSYNDSELRLTSIFFYDAIVTESKDLTTEPKLPRRRQLLRRAEESDCFHPNTPKDFYRHLYYEAFDITADEKA